MFIKLSGLSESMVHYMYTNVFEVVILDENFQIKERSKIDYIKQRRLLESNKFIDIEKEFAKKYEKLMFIGYKDDKLPNVVFSSDINKLESVTQKVTVDSKKLHNLACDVLDIKLIESVDKDNFIIQAVNSVDELTRSINTHVKRLREWYELYNIEMSKKYTDSLVFIEQIINSDEIITDTAFNKKDINEIKEFAKVIKKLIDAKVKQEEYLNEVMQQYCPNLFAIAGPSIGAHLIELAGSMKRLSRMPAQTIQLLGAEKALFKFLKKRSSKSPKYGILHEHPLVQHSQRKGACAKALADKIAICAKVDYFNGEFVGDKIYKSLEARFK